MARRRLDVNGRTVFVTGAARGIGGGVAERMHSKGANVALVGLEPDLLEERAAKLGDRAAWFEADVTDTEALERAVKGTVERFGGIDVAVANAGIHTVGSLITAPPEQIERTMNVNLFGVWRTDRAVLPHVIERKGYLLNIASLAAAAHAPLMGPYAASKAGVEGLTDSLRVEMAPTGARAGCAYFGFIDTDLVKASMRASVDQGDGGHDAGVDSQGDAGLGRGGRDRARHRAPLRPRLGAPLRRRRARDPRHHAAPDRAANDAHEEPRRGDPSRRPGERRPRRPGPDAGRRRGCPGT